LVSAALGQLDQPSQSISDKPFRPENLSRKEMERHGLGLDIPNRKFIPRIDRYKYAIYLSLFPIEVEREVKDTRLAGGRQVRYLFG
jgi:hypothetical protein